MFKLDLSFESVMFADAATDDFWANIAYLKKNY